MATLDQDHHALMRCLSQTVDPSRLVQLLGQARDCRLSSGLVTFRLPEAMALWSLQRPGEALTVLDVDEPLLENDAQTWVLRGLAHRAMPNGNSAALAAYKRAHKLDPDRSDVLYNIGNLLYEKHPEQAFIFYWRSLELKPLQALCWLNIALVQLLEARSED